MTLLNTLGPPRRWRLIWKPACKKLTEMRRLLPRLSATLLGPRAWRRSHVMPDYPEKASTKRFPGNEVRDLILCSRWSKRLGYGYTRRPAGDQRRGRRLLSPFGKSPFCFRVLSPRRGEQAECGIPWMMRRRTGSNDDLHLAPARRRGL
jgi:hypothetical protein